MQRTFKLRNDVNLKKSTLKLVKVAGAPSGVYHLEFAFDAASECTIRVYYAATEMMGADGTPTFTPLKESGAHPVETRPPGLNQTFRTQGSHALDASAYKPEELTHTSNRYPIIVSLEATPSAADGHARSAVQSQTTFATLGTAVDSNGERKLSPLKQKIQVGAVSYELQEIYGIDAATAAGSETHGEDTGEGVENSRECVICMTEPRDTTALPCRHLCMCSECAKVLRMQSETCPICRSPIEQLLQIQISDLE